MPVERGIQQGRMRSFIDLLHEVPAVLEALPLEAHKALSATCRSLRTSFCAQIKVITMSDAEDASRLCCMTWPQLLMVVCTGGSKLIKLSTQWEQAMEVLLSAITTSWQGPTAVLVRPCQQAHTPLRDLSTQHATALSNFADKHRHDIRCLRLWGPLVRCSAIQSLVHDLWPTLRCLSLSASPQLEAGSISHFSKSLPNLAALDIKQCSAAALELLRSGTAWPRLINLGLADNQLDPKLISLIPRARWTQLRYLNLDSNMIGTAGVQHLVACSWSHLTILILANTGIGEPALSCLAHGRWPRLCLLDLTENNIDATGVSHLVQGSWPLLNSLMLSDQGLDQKACSLLSIEYPASEAQKSGLQQFPRLIVSVIEESCSCKAMVLSHIYDTLLWC